MRFVPREVKISSRIKLPLHFPGHVTSSPPAGDLKISSVANSVDGKKFPSMEGNFHSAREKK